ncbi:MAG: glycosyltransferase family 4 protein [Anaerolineales bacterium]
MSPTSHKLAFPARLTGVGGPSVFQRRLAEGLGARGVECVYDAAEATAQAILVIGATRHIGDLARARRRGIPIVQRLNGRNWIHRRRRTGVLHYLRAVWNNRRLRLVRDRFATAVVYQSEFARGWWEGSCGVAPVHASVVLNGVPLDRFTPRGPEQPPADRWRVLVLEARFGGGYEIGLEWAVELASRLARGGKAVELNIVGVQDGQIPGPAPSGVRIEASGAVPNEQVPALDRGAHFLFSSDLLPACPNSVIEALGCGLPTVAFDTGSLSEIVKNDAGRLAEYGGDPWRLDPPDLDGLAVAAGEVLMDLPRFRAAARARAEEAFSLDRMVQGYLDVLGW